MAEHPGVGLRRQRGLNRRTRAPLMAQQGLVPEQSVTCELCTSLRLPFLGKPSAESRCSGSVFAIKAGTCLPLVLGRIGNPKVV